MKDRTRRFSSLGLLAVIVLFLLTACGSSTDSGDASVAVSTVAGGGGTVAAIGGASGRAGTGVSAAGTSAAGSLAGSSAGSSMPAGAAGRGPGAPAGAAGSPNTSAGASGSGAAGSPMGGGSAVGTAGAGTIGGAGGRMGPTSGTASEPGAGGSGMAGACPHVQLKGTDICTIGDSWIQIPGNQVTTLEMHMQKAGVIGANEHFDRREVSGSTLSAIISTYERKPMNCKILVMDGGGIDLFTTPAGNTAAVMPVVQKFKDFLTKLKTDGYVQHIIYSLYPVIPSTRNLNVNMKPGYSEACAASEVDCHLVDLEPLFMGMHFGADQTHPDMAGGTIIGDAWWKTMQQNCIAQ